MVGSTVLACRATLKLESVLDAIEIDNNNVVKVKEQVDSGNVPETVTYTDDEVERDLQASPGSKASSRLASSTLRPSDSASSAWSA
jgi:hypothetical protein